jgi:hypothetical protein
MKRENKLAGEKKVYEKPKLTIIELAVDEVLFIGCKLASGGMAWEVSPCVPGGCSQEGS